MGGIFSGVEKFRSKRTTQVIASPGCHMASGENFFVLDVFSGKRKQLGAKTKLANYAGCGIMLKLLVSFVHQFLVSTNQFSFDDCALGNFHAGQSSIGKAKGK